MGTSRADAFVNGPPDPQYWEHLTDSQRQAIVDWFNSQRPGVPDLDPATPGGALEVAEGAGEAAEAANAATLGRAGLGLLGSLSGLGTIYLGADLAVKFTTGQGLTERAVVFATDRFWPTTDCAVQCGWMNGYPRGFHLEAETADSHPFMPYVTGVGPSWQDVTGSDRGWSLSWDVDNGNYQSANYWTYYGRMNPPTPDTAGAGTMNRLDGVPSHDYEAFYVPDWGLPIKKPIHKVAPGEDLPDVRTVPLPSTPLPATDTQVKTWVESPGAAPVRTWLATNPNDVGTLVGTFPPVNPATGVSTGTGTGTDTGTDPGDPNRTATPADTDPSTCNLPSVRAIDLGPLSVGLGDKFPFGIFAWLSGAFGGLVAGGIAPRITVPMPGHIDPLVLDLAPFGGIWDVIHPVMLICAALSLCWLLARTAMGIGGSGDGE